MTVVQPAANLSATRPEVPTRSRDVTYGRLSPRRGRRPMGHRLLSDRLAFSLGHPRSDPGHQTTRAWLRNLSALKVKPFLCSLGEPAHGLTQPGQWRHPSCVT